MSMPFPPSTRVPTATTLVAASLPPRVRETLLAVHALAFELVVDPLDRVIPDLESRLTTLQDRGATHTVSVSYLDQAQLLRRRQRDLVARFAAGIDRALAGLRQPPPDRAGAPAVAMPSFTELRLVGLDEADEGTEVRAIATRHESRAALPLHLLCQRFAVLAAVPAFEPGELPIGPRRLCEMLLAAAEDAGLSLAVRIALVREFDRQVLVDFQGVAAALNDLLAHHRIMPGLSYVPLRPRPRVAPVTGEPDAERPLTGWNSQPSADADAMTFQLLQQLLGSRRAMADRFRAGAQGAQRPRAELETTEVVDLLDGAGAAAQGQDFEDLRQWLLLRARQKHGEAVALSAHDADTFELLGMLYAQLARELRTGTVAAGILEQLRLPLLKLALSDPGFFVRGTHPGRELLNAVAEAGAKWQAAEGADPQLVGCLQDIVAGLGEPGEDIGAGFQAAVRSLETQQQALARRADISERRLVEAARGKEKLAIARTRSTAVIEEALQGVRLPLFHRNMLSQAWADALTLAHLRYGDGHPEWQGLVEATGELVRAGSGAAAAPAELQAQVEQWLATVGYHADDAGRISRILTATVQDEDDEAASRTELALRLKARTRLGEEAVPACPPRPPRTAAEQAQFERARTLPFGTWLEFTAGDGTRMRHRMSWLSPVTGTVLFVNQRGQRVAESTLDTLARQMAAGEARVVTAAEGRLVDRAWRAALQSLRSLGRPAEASAPSEGTA